ncbi:MAG TPA: hypothetical protein VFF06_13825 [Polyangia bacterium]|nr:hypothetical protein [Polyangia bacterium]
MRVLLVVLVLALIGGAVFLAQLREQAETVVQSAAAPAAAPRAHTPAQVHDCADQCEQTALLEQRPDEWLRACRARCKGEAAQRPYQPIRRITVAPADHHR